jgi:hypothetical protein
MEGWKMKKSDVLKLIPGTVVIHKRYGACLVKEVRLCKGELFGVQINPLSDEGKQQLRMDARVNFDAPFLNASIRDLSHVGAKK